MTVLPCSSHTLRAIVSTCRATFEIPDRLLNITIYAILYGRPHMVFRIDNAITILKCIVKSIVTTKTIPNTVCGNFERRSTCSESTCHCTIGDEARNYNWWEFLDLFV